ncbi:MAG: hypothetical protein FWD91_00565 [Treponema sp.]|nr:hypothetical protein [Treponema sp.]
MKVRAVFLLLFIIPLAGVSAQTPEIDPSMAGTAHFDMTGFPQWTKDLRRGTIVAFGAFPFVYIFANMGYDMYRLSIHDGDARYAPWPFTSAGGIGHTEEETFRILGITAMSSIAVAIIDYSIEMSKRKRRAREAEALAPGTPIIIRTPLNGEFAPPNAETEAP